MAWKGCDMCFALYTLLYIGAAVPYGAVTIPVFPAWVTRWCACLSPRIVWKTEVVWFISTITPNTENRQHYILFILSAFFFFIKKWEFLKLWSLHSVNTFSEKKRKSNICSCAFYAAGRKYDPVIVWYTSFDWLLCQLWYSVQFRSAKCPIHHMPDINRLLCQGSWDCHWGWHWCHSDQMR